VTPELLEWAEVIFVMETRHRAGLRRRFGAHIGHARVVCLDIRDEYGFMDAGLVELLWRRVGGCGNAESASPTCGTTEA